MSGPPPLRFYSMVLIVADLPAMRDWYGRVLGFRERLSGPGFAVMAGAGTAVELVARADAVRPPEAADPLAQAGWRTLDLETDDLAVFEHHAQAEGAAILWSRRVVAPGRAMTLLRDPEGNLVAILGPIC